MWIPVVGLALSSVASFANVMTGLEGHPENFLLLFLTVPIMLWFTWWVVSEWVS